MNRDRSPFGLVAVFALILPLLSVSACSTNPATGEQSFTAFMSEQDEIRVGAEEHPKILKEMGGTPYIHARATAIIYNIYAIYHLCTITSTRFLREWSSLDQTFEVCQNAQILVVLSCKVDLRWFRGLA